MKVLPWSFQGNQRAPHKGIGEGNFRQTAYSKARLNTAFNGLGVFELHKNIKLWQQAVHGSVKCLASPRALLPQNPGGCDKLVFTEFIEFCERVFGTTKDHQIIFSPPADIEIWM